MKKILCIDDSKAVHAFLKDCIKETEYQITSMHNGEEGLKHLQGIDDHKFYDLIFLDWEMPGLNGPDVFDKLMEIKVASPIIMLTSKNDPNDISMMLNKGAAEYVLKPFTKDIILEKINSVLIGI